jgi:tetratricopeptide (TPR) repeat protein
MKRKMARNIVVVMVAGMVCVGGGEAAAGLRENTAAGWSLPRWGAVPPTRDAPTKFGAMLAMAGAQSATVARVDAKTSFERGQAALQAGDLDAAEKAFRAVLAVDAGSAAAYANLGVIAMRRMEWERALGLLRKAERLDPKMSGVRLNIGLVEFRRGNYVGAIAPLSAVMREQPGSGQARYLLGLCEVLTERYAEAVMTLEPLWEERSGEVMYLYVLGIAAHNAGEKELDERALAKMLDVGGDQPELHLILGKAYLNRQENEKAVVELEKALDADARLPFGHFNLGVAKMRTGDDDGAEKEFLADIAVEPDVAENYAELGFLYAREQKREEAEKEFGEALRRDGRMDAARFGLAQIYFDEGKFAAGLREANAVVRAAPESQKAHYLRARILGRLGRAEEAKAEMAVTQRLMNANLGKARADLGEGTVANPELTRGPK